MKKILFILLMLPFLVQGQENLKGKFYPVKKDIGFVNELFDFNEDAFHVTIRHCQGLDIGKGKYKIIEDTLILNFDNYPTGKSSELVRSNKSASNSTNFLIHIFSETDSSALPGVNLIVKEKNPNTIKHGTDRVQGTITDENGMATLSIQNEENEKFIHVSFIGFLPVEIPIDKTLGNFQEYKIYLGFNSYFQKGDIIKHRIKKLNNNAFMILYPNNYKVQLARISKKTYEKLRMR